MKIKERMENVNVKEITKVIMETVVGGKVTVRNYILGRWMALVQNATAHRNFDPVKKAKHSIFETPFHGILKKYSKFAESVSVSVGWLQNTDHFEKWLEQTLDAMRKGRDSVVKKI
ncbi:unnamed protein product [Allacma fusca]|uniref:Uncharacterized protein n=1 Tax=Allacma fusca TaxID=39272 RepID=A0A8J2KSK5_9HEXA|nr:unnamed protein product [Allacma fusca]